MKITTKSIILLIVSLFVSNSVAFSKTDSNTITLVRMFSKDIFETNGAPFLKPMVQSMNATSNSRFFNSAYVPRQVRKPYFKVSVNTMLGFVPEDYKTYNPTLPLENFNLGKMGEFIEIIDITKNKYLIKDTIGLAYYAFKTIITDAINKKYVTLPKTSTTILGNEKAAINLPHDSLMKAMREHPAYALLPAAMKDTLAKYIGQFPETFNLPPGLNMTKFFAAIPQVEIGSLFGTEALVRFIPPVDMGENIGKFAFWGIGLKHNISQYFTDYKRYAELSPDEYDSLRSMGETPFDLAAQFVYQGTYLENKVGVTNAELDAKAQMFDFNLQFSKRFCKYFEMYAAYSYEMMNINANYKYTIPWELQIKLGMVTEKLDSKGKPIIDPATGWPIYEARPPQFPGDLHPQTSLVKLHDENHKFIVGANVILGKFNIFVDYNISKFSIFTAGVSYRF